jgi:hypothetical protein
VPVKKSSGNGKKGRTKFPGTVEKVIKPLPGSGEPEKAQIAVEGADHLYREIRVPNKLTDEDGNKLKLETGAEVEVQIECNGTCVSDSGEHPSAVGKTE